MKTNETSTREKALAWWNNLSQENQIDLQYIYRSPSRHPLNSIGLTGREIEELWKKENVNYQISDTEFVMKDSYKPNQKQFTEFSEEHFWRYFKKFKHQDKVKMYELLKSWYEVDGNMPY